MSWNRLLLCVVVMAASCTATDTTPLGLPTAKIKWCIKKTACSCKTESGKLVDLSPIQRLTAKSGAHPELVFEWQPCVTFNIGHLPAPASIVSHNKTSDMFVDIGGLVNSRFTLTSGRGTVVYTMVSFAYLRQSKIRLVCNRHSTVWTFEKEKPEGTYNFVLYAPEACVSSDTDLAVSAGTIVLIVVLGLVLVYLITGFIYQTNVVGAQGCDRIPHVSFWSSLPGLVKDGCRFVLNCGRLPHYVPI